ncbi:MAG: CtsR family transcriptional regulator [Acutalibacteraceae bacterium]
MRLSDVIADEINRMLDESGDGSAEIKRNELASHIGCVPSQINYVISSRFVPEQGYIVESRRGGGGFIKITRVHLDKSSAIMHIVNIIGKELDDNTARVILDNCRRGGLLTDAAARLIYSAISSQVMSNVPVGLRDALRAAAVKQMLLSQV